MVLIIVMMVATLLLVALTAVLPSVYQEGQREREEELIFRGIQYGLAVARFHRQFNRYPVSVRELIETNQMRFLRKEYKNPMDPKGKWRFIHANAAGVLLDSKNQPIGAGGLGQPGSLGSGVGQSGNLGGGMGQSSFTSGFGQSSGQGLGLGGGMGQQTTPSQGQGVQTTTPQFSSFSLSSSDSSNPIQGAFIVGVAPTTHHESIRIWNKKQHYDEWEFLGIDLGALGIQVGLPAGATAQPGTNPQLGPNPQPASSNSGFSLGGTNPTSPTNSVTPTN